MKSRLLQSIVIGLLLGIFTCLPAVAANNVRFDQIEWGTGTTDTTMARSSAGNITVEGNILYRAGGTDVAVADGGTGQSSYTNGQLLIGNTTGNTLTKATLTAGAGISITNGNGSITIAANGSAPRVTTITSSGTPAINTDDCDAVTITAQAAAITSMSSSLTGTPSDFQRLLIRIKDDGTARAIAWGASYVDSGSTLPVTTVASKVTTIGLIYDSVKAKWVCIAVDQEP